jgi:hypothetical protein
MKNGLYSVQFKTLDGRNSLTSGVVVIQDGAIYGGDGFLYYTGSYSFKGGQVKGELVLNQHRPYPPGSTPFFGAGDIGGVGVSGTYEGDKVELFATALVGKKSVSLQATMRKLADLS